MNRRALLNLFLLAGVAALGVLAWLQPGLERAQPGPLTPIDASAVSRIRIDRGNVSIELRRTPHGWVLPGAPELPADRLQVGALLGLLSERPRRSYPADELDLAQAGLRPPLARLVFDGLKVAVGGTAPLEGLRYLQMDDRVYLVEDHYGPLVQGDRLQFVSRRLLPQGTRITALRLPGLRLEPSGTGGWQTEPAGALSGEEARARIEAWQTASAVWVKVLETLPEEGARIEIEMENAEPLRFLLARRNGEGVLVRPDLGLEYHLGSRQLEALLGDPSKEN